MDRKIFIKQSALGCLGLTGVLGLASCGNITTITVTPSNNSIEIPLTQMADKSILKVRSKNLQYDILLVKKTDGTYYSLYMKCTHNDAAVMFDGQNFQCPLHGSSFNKLGAVTNGPATTELKKLKTETNNQNIIINTQL
jgi:nitrite reductase/ring-hydroxylating ferredoxin subunit